MRTKNLDYATKMPGAAITF